MFIGINASSALKENPTGVEEYTYQLIKHLAMIPESRAHRFVLYLNPNLRSSRLEDLENLPKNFQLKFLSFPFLWTQLRLAWEMLSADIDVLFIPVHILPAIHPRKTVVTLHGLEYEYYPELYSFWHRVYIRFATAYALKNSSKIISISENTKKDLVKLYGGNPDKITVVHHGFNYLQPTAYPLRQSFSEASKLQPAHILYIGRIELKKNILGIVEAYDDLRKRNPNILNRLILAGSGGFGFEKIKKRIENSPHKKDIILKGYVSEKEKNNLLENAVLFAFPSHYEGFGLPVLEAQAAGVPVVASRSSCLPEISGRGALLADGDDPQEISGAFRKIILDADLRRDLIANGFENIKRFSWEKCARETLEALTK